MPVRQTEEYRSADTEIARFAERYLLIRGTTARACRARQCDLEHYGAFLRSRVLGMRFDAKAPPPYEQLVRATAADVLAYQSWLAHSHRRARYVIRGKLATLRTFYEYLRATGRRNDDPAAGCSHVLSAHDRSTQTGLAPNL